MPSYTPAATVFLVLALTSSAASAQQKSKQHTWSGIERIVAVGDVHGDHGQFLKTLLAAKVIDKETRWIGGRTHLVQTGDLFDRGPDSRKTMDLLMKLEGEAKKAGGHVHCLAGNHEEMILRGDWRYVHPGEVQAFGDNAKYSAAVGPEGVYGKWIRKHNGVIKINNVLFDQKTDEAVCVIDLDTVMPGLSLYDCGDLVRPATNPAAEDERDLDKVQMNLGVFESLVEGYLAAAGSVLNECEVAHMAFSGRLISLELGMRFLTDHLNGDHYFRVHREGQNLDRARTQLRLASQITENQDEMNKFVQKVASSQ